VFDHSRNLDDEQLEAIKKNGGVVQTVGFAGYVKVTPPTKERTEALEALAAEYKVPVNTLGRGGRGGGGRGGAARGNNPVAQLTDEQRAGMQRKLDKINAQHPAPPRANVSDFVDHIDYLVKKIGVDHIGISSDFDGGGGVDGWNNAAETFNVTLELVRRGYTEQQIEKIWSGNLLRVMNQVQKVAARQ
jgi:membrane dipeptidase